MASTYMLDPATERVARSFLAVVKRQYGVADTHTFGSQVRGDATSESDTDVAVLQHGLPGRRKNSVCMTGMNERRCRLPYNATVIGFGFKTVAQANDPVRWQRVPARG